MPAKHMSLRKRLKRRAAKQFGVPVLGLEWRNGILHYAKNLLVPARLHGLRVPDVREVRKPPRPAAGPTVSCAPPWMARYHW